MLVWWVAQGTELVGTEGCCSFKCAAFKAACSQCISTPGRWSCAVGLVKETLGQNTDSSLYCWFFFPHQIRFFAKTYTLTPYNGAEAHVSASLFNLTALSLGELFPTPADFNQEPLYRAGVPVLNFSSESFTAGSAGRPAETRADPTGPFARCPEKGWGGFRQTPAPSSPNGLSNHRRIARGQCRQGWLEPRAASLGFLL